MQNYLQMLQRVANSLQDVTFLKYGLPIITLVGVLVLGYFGVQGIIKKETIWLIRPAGSTRTAVSQTEVINYFGKTTGTAAVLLGIVYIILALGLLFILGPLSYFLLV